MKKAIIIVSFVLVVLVVAAGAFLWFVMQQSLYEPGMVRSEENLRAALVPPAQPEESPGRPEN